MSEEFGFTEADLREAGVGKYIESRDYGYDKKRRLYRRADVWKAFSDLRNRNRQMCTDETGYVNHTLAAKVAQMQIDTYLLKRAEGKDVSVPVPVEDAEYLANSSKAKKKDSEPTESVLSSFLHDKADYGDAGKAEIDPIRDITWIYNNLAVKDVEPSDAPSPGAYAQLKFIQSDDSNLVDFFTKVYPRLIPSKSQVENLTKFNDDGREHFELLDKLSGEVGSD